MSMLKVLKGIKFKKSILACGAELKNTFCLARNNKLFQSEIIGDLETFESLNKFEREIEYYKKKLSIKSEVIVYDKHPEYLSTKYALEILKSNPRIKGIPVQHHYAHLVSCVFDSTEKLLKEKVIGVAFDGLGYGDDDKFWGGEFFVFDFKSYKRVAHLEYVPMPGGKKAILQPWRMACIYLQKAFGYVEKAPAQWKIIKQSLEKKINSPETSSMGRLFDAVSAILGIKREIEFEAQAAIELEKNAWEYTQEYEKRFRTINPYRFSYRPTGEIHIISPLPVIKSIVSDIKKGLKKQEIAYKFHVSSAGMVCEVCKIIRKKTGIKKIALSGGVFQNKLLLKLVVEILKKNDFTIILHKNLPPNDSGISLGQAIIAINPSSG